MKWTLDDKGMKIELPFYSGTADQLAADAVVFCHGKSANGWTPDVPNPDHIAWAALPATIPDPNHAGQTTPNPAKGVEPALTIPNPETKEQFAGRRILVTLGENIKVLLYNLIENSPNLGGLTPTQARAAVDVFLDGANGKIAFSVTN